MTAASASRLAPAAALTRPRARPRRLRIESHTRAHTAARVCFACARPSVRCMPATNENERPRARALVLVRASAAGFADGDVKPSTTTASQTRVIVICLGIAMLLASADRTIFAAAALSIKAELAMSLKDVGAAQSAFLWGYGVTQLAAGAASDRYGGAKVLLFGLFLWSTAVALTPLSGGVYAILAARFMFGAASGCALPASAAAVAAHVPAERRSGALSTIFALFNIGSAFGLAAAGGLIATFGWKFVFYLFGLFGACFAFLAYSLMPESVKQYVPRVSSAVASETTSSKDAELEVDDLPTEVATQLVALLWCHIVVNWGFMILQSWLPIYLAQDLGLSIASSGLAGAIPWLFTAFMSFSSGQVADKLINKYNWEKWKVRRLAMNIATIGPAVCLFALKATTTPAVALGFVIATLGLQAVAVAGYHSYLQDVAPSRAGAILGFTNTVGVVAAIIANMVTGASVEATGSFQTVFLYTASMYLSSCFAWNSFLKGQMLFP